MYKGVYQKLQQERKDRFDSKREKEKRERRERKREERERERRGKEYNKFFDERKSSKGEEVLKEEARKARGREDGTRRVARV